MDPLTLEMLELSVEHPDTPDVSALLLRHFELMRSLSPAESCHVMAPDTLIEADVTLLGIRRDGHLLAVGAVARIGPHDGELKSMHTANEARGLGLGRKMVGALIEYARQNGMTRLSLETGSAPAFSAARALYAAEGFTTCEAFGGYVTDPLSVFMTRSI